MSKRDYSRSADRHNAMSRPRGLRTPKPLPKLRALCTCGHRAVVSIHRSAVPTLRCSKCGTRGLIRDFLTPLGKAYPTRAN